MVSFLIALAVLVGGYFVYGAVAEKVFGVRPKDTTPAYSRADGVDFMPMSTWRVFLIQFLNIAGLGPIFGAIMGIMFGPAAFLWIALGTIFGGAVHDFMGAMMSVRSGGSSLPEITGRELGGGIKQFMRVWTIILMILVGAVFVISPAGLLDNLTGGSVGLYVWVAIIFIYYMLATLLPIDKLIGNIYPVFGFALLFMALGLMVVLIFGSHHIPDGFADGLFNRYPNADGAHPIFPMMFVSIACGAISGFHATQSPMMARCLKNERLARPVFYGAMVAEGIVALIWAAAAITFASEWALEHAPEAAGDGYSSLVAYKTEAGKAFTTVMVHDVATSWLGTVGGILAILGVIAAPITTGDTALRSTRLIISDIMHLNQRTILRRLAVSLPIFALCFLVMCLDYDILWRYFAWFNQCLAVFTLWAITVYLGRHRKAYVITLLPAMFMTAVCVSYFFFARPPEGFIGLSQGLSISIGCAVAVGLMLLFMAKLPKMRLPLRKSYLPQ